MADILGITLPATGHLMAQLPVLAELARRGHAVRCLSLEPYRALIEGFGVDFEALPVDAGTEQKFINLAADHPRGLPLLPLYTRLLETTPALLEALARRPDPPDAVLADAACPWSWRLACRWGRPCATLVPSFAWTLPSTLSSPAALLDLGPQLPSLPALVRAQHHLARIGNEPRRPVWAFLEPQGERILVLTSRDFQPAAWSVPRGWRFIGPTSPAGDEPSQPAPDRPQLYASLGTVVGAQLPWWRTAVAALTPPPGDPGWPALLATGPQISAAQLGPLPPHIRLTPWADQPRELAASRVFLTHGGMSGVGEALRLGVPMVVSPQVMDGFWVASRLHRLGAGLNVGPRPDARTLRRAVERVWSDPRFAERAAELGRGLRAAGGARRAADEVESLLT